MIAPDDQGDPPSAPHPKRSRSGRLANRARPPRRREQLDQDWIDRVLGRDAAATGRARRRAPRRDGRSGAAAPPPDGRARYQDSRPTQ